MKEKLSSLTNWIEKKDLTYILIMITIVWLLSSDYGKENQPLLDNWNFAATIVSIILAVLAIVYTFAQSASTLNSTRKLEDAVDKIEETSTVLENINVGDLLSSLEKKINSLEKNVDQKIQNRLDKHIEQMSVLFKPIDFTSSFDFSFITSEQWKEYLTECIKTTPNPIGVLFVHIYFKKKLQLNYDFSQLANWVDQENSRFIEGAIKGKFDLLKSFNIISSEDRTTVESMLPNLEIALTDFIEDENNKDLLIIRHSERFLDQL